MGGRGQTSMSSRFMPSRPIPSPSKGEDGTRGHLSFGSVDDPIAQIMADTGISEAAANQIMDDLEDWAFHSYSEIRRAQINGEDSIRADQAGNIEAYVSMAPKWGDSGDTYRGMVIPREALQNFLTVGFDVDDGGLASWTSDLSVAEEAASGIRDGARIVLRSRTQRRGASITHLVGDGESEVLVSGNAQHRVVKWTHDKKSDTYTIDVEE